MEVAVIAIIALIVLGPNKLPEAARALGKGVREMRDSFQDGQDDEDEDLRLDTDDEDDEDEDGDEEEPAEDELVPLETGSAPQEGIEDDEPHQKDARSSVPSASSSSTERE